MIHTWYLVPLERLMTEIVEILELFPLCGRWACCVGDATMNGSRNEIFRTFSFCHKSVSFDGYLYCLCHCTKHFWTEIVYGVCVSYWCMPWMSLLLGLDSERVLPVPMVSRVACWLSSNLLAGQKD